MGQQMLGGIRCGQFKIEAEALQIILVILKLWRTTLEHKLMGMTLFAVRMELTQIAETMACEAVFDAIGASQA